MASFNPSLLRLNLLNQVKINQKQSLSLIQKQPEPARHPWMKAFLLIKSHFLQPRVVTARLSYRGQKVLLHYWTAWTDACPLGSSEAIRGAAEWSCRSKYSCCHYSRPSAKTLLDYRNGAEQVKEPLRPIRREWPRADGPRMCRQYLLSGGPAACWACRAP